MACGLGRRGGGGAGGGKLHCGDGFRREWCAGGERPVYVSRMAGRAATRAALRFPGDPIPARNHFLPPLFTYLTARFKTRFAWPHARRPSTSASRRMSCGIRLPRICWSAERISGRSRNSRSRECGDDPDLHPCHDASGPRRAQPARRSVARRRRHIPVKRRGRSCGRCTAGTGPKREGKGAEM